jgi:citrate synthase
MSNDADAISAWWRTSIIDMAPGKIEFRGHPIQDLVGTVSFPQMIWLMTAARLPSVDEAALLEAALVAGVDHGPQAPSIAAARMTATCGVGLNNAMANGVNMLGDVHGGAGEQCADLYYDINNRIEDGAVLADAVQSGLDAWRAENGKIVSGFGHRFHKPVDPRAPRLMTLVRDAAKGGDGIWPLRRHRRGCAGQSQRAQTTGHEHRRGNSSDFLRTWVPRAFVTGPVLPVPFCRNSGARVGTNAAGRAQQRADATCLFAAICPFISSRRLNGI